MDNVNHLNPLDSHERQAAVSAATSLHLSTEAQSLLSRSPEQNNPALQSAPSPFLPSLEVSFFQSRAENLLKSAKPDANYNYEPSDIVRLMQDPNIKGEDAIAAATIYQLYKENLKAPDSVGGAADKLANAHYLPSFQIGGLQNLSVFDNDDLSNLGALKSDSGFAAADKNHDGLLSADEIASQPAYKRLVHDVPFLEQQLSIHPGGVDQDTIARIDISTEYLVAESRHVQLLNDEATDRLNLAPTRALYADAAHPLNSIKVNDVNQGGTGDCFFEAVLGSVVKAQPEIISQSIKDNNNGTYTVSFKGDSAHPVTIDSPTDAELATYASAGVDGVWPAVMEKAYAQYAVQYGGRSAPGQTTQDAIYGGNPDDVIQLLTGHKVDQMIAPNIDAEKLRAAVQSNRVVSVTEVDDKDLANGMQAHHAYSVVGYDSADGGIFILRDPRGANVIDRNRAPLVHAEDLQKLPLFFSVENDISMQLNH